jgi:hypothetical protein
MQVKKGLKMKLNLKRKIKNVSTATNHTLESHSIFQVGVQQKIPVQIRLKLFINPHFAQENAPTIFVIAHINSIILYKPIKTLLN